MSKRFVTESYRVYDKSNEELIATASTKVIAQRIAEGLNMLEGLHSSHPIVIQSRTPAQSERLHVAALAMQGLLADSDYNPAPDEMARHAVACADALLRRLAQE